MNGRGISVTARATALLVRNTNRLYADRILHPQFASRNRRIWRAIEKHGAATVRGVMKALWPAMDAVAGRA